MNAWLRPAKRDAKAFVLTESAETMPEAAALLVRFQFEDQGERASSFGIVGAVGRSVDAELFAPRIYPQPGSDGRFHPRTCPTSI